MKGDIMRKMKLEISKGCDRYTTAATKNQIGFVNFCVKPLALSMNVMIEELEWCLNNMQLNEQKWKEIASLNTDSSNSNEQG